MPRGHAPRLPPKDVDAMPTWQSGGHGTGGARVPVGDLVQQVCQLTLVLGMRLRQARGQVLGDWGGGWSRGGGGLQLRTQSGPPAP